MTTKMNSKTFEHLSQQLYQQIQEHPHKHEVVSLAVAQLLDDSDTQITVQETFEAF